MPAPGPTLPLVLYLSGNQPEEARQELSGVLQSLRGEVRICDQYYGPGMLSKLRSLEGCARVHVLTRKLGVPDIVAVHEMQDFKKDFPKFEFRKHSGSGLHDRFIISQDQLILLGQSLKDFGGSESFVVVLNREIAGDIIKTVRDSFNDKWKDAQRLIPQPLS